MIGIVYPAALQQIHIAMLIIVEQSQSHLEPLLQLQPVALSPTEYKLLLLQIILIQPRLAL
jgi:hypothetical protein